MPTVAITMPQLGESIAEATIIRHLVAPGDTISTDQQIIEVETSKATMTVTATCDGVILEFNSQVGESYPVGSVLGKISVTDETAARLGLTGSAPAQNPENPGAETPSVVSGAEAPRTPPPTAHTRARVEPTIRGLPVPAHAGGASYMSPRMKARMEELGLHAADLAGIAGSGSNGRVTIEDFEKFIQSLEHARTTPASSMRVAVADAMRRSWTRPLATVGLPVGIDAMMLHRRQSDPKPGPALYALRALGLALAETSATAGRLVGHTLVHPGSIDLGFAVEAEDGVLVPVIRRVDQRPLAELVPVYQELLVLARQRRLPPNATGGSIATVTNFGTFGLTWATPIPLPEQTLVLGMGAGRKVPFWDESLQTFVPVTEAELTLSFDHRVLDGGAAGRLLSRVGQLLGQPDKL